MIYSFENEKYPKRLKLFSLASAGLFRIGLNIKSDWKNQNITV